MEVMRGDVLGDDDSTDHGTTIPIEISTRKSADCHKYISNLIYIGGQWRSLEPFGQHDGEVMGG